MSRFSGILLTLCILTGVPTLTAQEQTSSFEEFQELGERLVGRWAVDVTLIADWPGETKKQGDKLTGYAIYRWIADEKGLEWVQIGGNSIGKTLITFDASTKTIKGFHVGSDGGNWQSVIWKKNDNEWGWKLTGGGVVDGRKLGGTGSWMFKNDKSHVIQGSVILGDEKLPQLNDVYSRIND